MAFDFSQIFIMRQIIIHIDELRFKHTKADILLFEYL